MKKSVDEIQNILEFPGDFSTPNYSEIGLRLTEKERKEARGEIDWKALRKQARKYMIRTCPKCISRDNCDNYMNESYWVKMYTELRENGQPWKRTCPKFVHVMLRR